MIEFWNILLFALLLAPKSIRAEVLEPDRPNAATLSEYKIECTNNTIVTYKIINNQSKKYLHLIKNSEIIEFELYANYEKLDKKSVKDYDVFYEITPNKTLYLVFDSNWHRACVSFIFSDYDTITLKPNEEYKYPIVVNDQIFETNIKDTYEKHFILYLKSTYTTAPSFNYKITIEGEEYAAKSGDNVFSKIIYENETDIKIELPNGEITGYFTYELVSYNNITTDTLICKNDSDNFQSYFINDPKTNINSFWYSISSNKIEYYDKNSLKTNLHNVIHDIRWEKEDYFIFMKDKGCFQIKYFVWSSDNIKINNKDSILISNSDEYIFEYYNESNKNMEISFYSKEYSFINTITVANTDKSLEIKKDKDKFFYYFYVGSYYDIISNVTFNLTKEYIIIDIVVEEHVISEKIKIFISKEDNKETQFIGNNGTLEIITKYDDRESNIFSNLDIEFYSFDYKISDNNNHKDYKIKCRLWRGNNGIIKIFCKFLEDFIHTTTNLAFENLDLFSYKKRNLTILNYDDNATIPINQVNDYIAFIYSDNQLINLDNGDILTFKFKYDIYSGEELFLFDNKYKSVYFDYCSINSYENEIICQISENKIKSILSFSGENFYLASTNKYKGQYVFNNVGDIIISTDNIVKNNHYVKVTNLKNSNAELNSFIYYETNITKISNLTTKFFNINSDNSCMFKKRSDKNEPLLLVCIANKTGEFSLGEMKEQTLEDINIENNFIITEGSNNGKVSVKETGGIISSVYPQILNFSNEDYLYIYIGFNGELNGIKLNPDSMDNLICTKYNNNLLECFVNKSHFDNNENKFYNIYYENHLKQFSIKYEAPLIHVTFSDSEETEPDSENEGKEDEGENEGKEDEGENEGKEDERRK